MILMVILGKQVIYKWYSTASTCQLVSRISIACNTPLPTSIKSNDLIAASFEINYNNWFYSDECLLKMPWLLLWQTDLKNPTGPANCTPIKIWLCIEKLAITKFFNKIWKKKQQLLIKNKNYKIPNKPVIICLIDKQLQ